MLFLDHLFHVCQYVTSYFLHFYCRLIVYYSVHWSGFQLPALRDCLIVSWARGVKLSVPFQFIVPLLIKLSSLLSWFHLFGNVLARFEFSYPQFIGFLQVQP